MSHEVEFSVAAEMVDGPIAIAECEPRPARRIPQHLLQVLETPIEYRWHESFDTDCLAEILTSDATADADPGRKASVPRNATGVSQDIALLCNRPLLTKAEESRLFHRMNFLKYHAAKLRDEIGEPTRAALELVHGLLEEARKTRDALIYSNSRLVVSITKKYVDPATGFEELFSEGMMSLMHAIEKYDFARGNSFSTYATTAIRNNFHHMLRKGRKDRTRFQNVEETLFDAMNLTSSEPEPSEAGDDDPETWVFELMEHLTPQERLVVTARFGLGSGKPQTLKEVAATLGINRERVRQTQLAALRKLQSWAERDDRSLAFLV